MEIESRVLNFFKKNISKKVDKDYIINNPNYLGDEANILLEDFIKEFNISSGYLEVDKYFNKLPNFWEIITFSRDKKQKYPIIKISHMIEVAKRKEWFDPE
ncbi:DUF1493 family protein [Elizabethkingia miricola]|uniref:DUF1493 family protein n=1 Tax=Elizabethkingia TaxID=308865 RepID=UPI00193B33D4|nr:MULTISPECIES: DUF1493 family protein [Elizabethkingia]MCL1655939.1 DUF1493 family protein [Elizabethkingia miricola]QRI48312.1 DUF1493 family protein [Elizabethkingia anophelis]